METLDERQQHTHCPQCGAELKKSKSPARCAFCGWFLPQPGHDALPPEYSRLKRPRPIDPRGPSGCILLVAGLIFALFGVGFAVLMSKDNRSGMEVGMGVIFVLIGLLPIYVGIKALLELNQLRSSGRQAQGIIFDRWQTQIADDTPDYFVAYAFKAGPSQQIITAAERNKELFEKYQIGDTITVRYIPRQPTICEARLS